ncbi:glycine--tRNA ligase subunit beta [Bacillus smithii]|uniref:glycine--tRNA ligase subunit beta n=1 Tax=Bacillus smithii TaxID=1479 RepID=UPI003D1975E5
MTKRDLLLEIGLEEMPARFVTESMNQLGKKVEEFFQKENIDYGTVSLFSTPRRLAVLVKDVAESQADVHEEARGPAKKAALNEAGEWTKAAIGFSKSHSATVDDIYFKEVKGIEYAFVKKFLKGQPTVQLLPKLKELIEGMSFGKYMRWADYDLRYVRPIKWLVVLFGSEVIPFAITDVETNRFSYGHRFLGGKIQLDSPAEYETKLKAEYVIPNPDERKQLIRSQLKNLEEKHGWVIPIDEELLEEINNIVEYPTALFGSFQEEFLNLPEEVLITSMKEHQRYFPVKTADGKLLPHFVTVRNGNDRSLETVAKGNEKVLKARLADADFFYKEDQKLKISEALEKLSSIVYHEKIGTLAEKVARIRKLSSYLAERLRVEEETAQKADRAAEICKFDLVTHMVYEFPELQGIMGEKYALLQGENPEVARAINEHYQPRNSEDEPANSLVGAIVGVADKLDTIISCFAVDIIPTGSQDPYALRRQATGIVQTMLKHKWNLSLEALLKDSIDIVLSAGIGQKETAEIYTAVLDFFKQRMKHILEEKEVRYDVIEALLDVSIHSLAEVESKAEVLMKRIGQPSFKEVAEALSRVLNITKKATEDKEIRENLFANESEKELYERYVNLKKEWKQDISAEERFQLLESLRPAIERYFDETMVMTDDEEIRNNRLAQMKELSRYILEFANVNLLVIK